MSSKIAVIGLGYVGLPLALAFARSGAAVVGIDVDEKKIAQLKGGQSYLKTVNTADLSVLISLGKLEVTSNFEALSSSESVIICVPTPLSRHREPDLSYVLETGKSIGRYLRKGSLVVLESTTFPGTTEQDLRDVLERTSGMTAGVDFHLAFSPEREDPGNPSSHVSKIPKVIGGLTPECLEKASELYGWINDKLVKVSSCRTAEATKLLENIFRAVNIALVNELKVVYASMGIDVWEVINAAKTKPFGFMPFYPGPGLGGHCIPIDPFYLTWKAREYGQHTRFIELAGEINTAMPRYVVGKVSEALNERGKSVKGSKILILGLAYKADVDDIRESPTFMLMDLLEKTGASVDYHDPHVPLIPETREHSKYTGRKSVELKRENVALYDCVLVSTAHRTIDYAALAEWSQCVVDTRNVMRSGNVFKA